LAFDPGAMHGFIEFGVPTPGDGRASRRVGACGRPQVFPDTFFADVIARPRVIHHRAIPRDATAGARRIFERNPI